MQNWFGIIAEIKELNALIHYTILADDKLIIMSSLLTDNIENLTLIAKKIEWMSRVSARHEETESLLRFLLQAVSLRLRQLTSQPPSPRKSSLSREKFLMHFNKIYNALIIKKLKYICEQYKKIIGEHFISYIKKNDVPGYHYYFVLLGITSIDDLLRLEKEAYENGHFDLVPTWYIKPMEEWPVPELNEYDEIPPPQEYIEIESPEPTDLSVVNHTRTYLRLKEKYECVKILTSTLYDSLKPTEDCSENELHLGLFADYFIQYATILNAQIFPPTFLLTSTPEYYIENEFIITCNEIVAKIEQAATKPNYSYKGI